MNTKFVLLAVLAALFAVSISAVTLRQLQTYEFEDEEFHITPVFDVQPFDEDYDLQAGVYIVKSGDNLSSIASRNGCTLQQLISINGIQNANLIYVGQKITLCGGAPAPPAPPSPSGGSVYIVQSGDNLSAIASRFGCTLQQLISINGIQNANLIQVGQRITLCGGSGPSPPSPSPSPSLVLYKQCDSRWGSQALGFGGSTICSAGCLMSSVAAGLASKGFRLNGSLITPGSFAPWLRSNGGFQGDLFVHSAVSKLKGGFSYEGQKQISDAQYDDYIRRGATIVLAVNNFGHWVYSYKRTGAGTFAVLDSGYNRDSYSRGNIATFAIYWLN